MRTEIPAEDTADQSSAAFQGSSSDDGKHCFLQLTEFFFRKGKRLKAQKKVKDEYVFFRTPNGKISYCKKCKSCVHDCKQSFKAKVIACRIYIHRKR